DLKENQKLQAYMDSIEAIKNYAGPENLKLFFMSLERTEKGESGITRIGYFGDSMIEGDLMSKSLRQWMQEKYGGIGIGFMPITSMTAGFRTTIKHSFSDNWLYSSLPTGNKTDFLYGLSGEIFSIDSGTTETWVEYGAKYSSFPTTKLFYGKNDSLEEKKMNTVLFQENSFDLVEKNTVNTLTLNNQSTTEVRLDFQFNYPQPIYGLSLASNSGVIVDNFSSRGNSGMPLSAVSYSVLSQFNTEMHYDLIILQFGMNVLSGDMDYSWYKNSMKKVVAHYKAAIPTASILIVSVADKGSKNEDGEMETDPAIEPIVEAQREMARESEVAFFNLYQAMGGKNSMIKWAEELEYANKDYTHFNYKGASAATQMIYNYLIEEYEKAKALNELQNEEVQ
ncbi:MAG: GDSL-type esterase/lipase family protein, partial [Chitinophagales bacterium]